MMIFIVEDLLALPQMKQGKLPKHVHLSNIKEAVVEVGEILNFQMEAKGIQYDTRFGGSFTKGGESSSSNFLLHYDR